MNLYNGAETPACINECFWKMVPQSQPAPAPSPCSWAQHKDTLALMGLMKYIGLTLPKTIVLENVHGLACKDRDADMSPLDLVIQMLREHQYVAHPVYLDLQSFHAVVRQRTDRERERE